MRIAVVGSSSWHNIQLKQQKKFVSLHFRHEKNAANSKIYKSTFKREENTRICLHFVIFKIHSRCSFLCSHKTAWHTYTNRVQDYRFGYSNERNKNKKMPRPWFRETKEKQKYEIIIKILVHSRSIRDSKMCTKKINQRTAFERPTDRPTDRLQHCIQMSQREEREKYAKNIQYNNMRQMNRSLRLY